MKDYLLWLLKMFLVLCALAFIVMFLVILSDTKQQQYKKQQMNDDVNKHY